MSDHEYESFCQRFGPRVSSRTMEARSRHSRWMRGKQRSGIRVAVCRTGKEQLEQNDLCYVACSYDNISALRDGKRRAESKLLFVCSDPGIHRLHLQRCCVLGSLVWREWSHEPRSQIFTFNNCLLLDARCGPRTPEGSPFKTRTGPAVHFGLNKTRRGTRMCSVFDIYT